MARKERVQKSNAMRELDRAGISYDAVDLGSEEDVSRGLGERMATLAGMDLDATFKTLVCVSPQEDYVVCCIPVAQELDLKKAAQAAGEKSLALMPLRDLELVTGYVRGGCSPIGMKKAFPTLIDETAQLFDRMAISGGRRGLSLILSPEDLRRFCSAAYADIIRI